MKDNLLRKKRTQVFIETPYRNLKLFQEMLAVLSPSTMLCIACDLTTEKEYIKTLSVQAWQGKLPDINKRPAIFILYAAHRP